MRLGVEHPGILPIGARDLELGVLIRVDQVRVLEHLGEEEGLLEIGEVAAVGGVDVGDGAVAAADARVLGDVGEAGEGPLGMGNRQCLLVLSSGGKVQIAFSKGMGDVRLGICDRRWRGMRSRTTQAPPGVASSSRW